MYAAEVYASCVPIKLSDDLAAVHLVGIGQRQTAAVFGQNVVLTGYINESKSYKHYWGVLVAGTSSRY